MEQLSMEERIRQAQEKAWDDGYQAGKIYDYRFRRTWKMNPYRRVVLNASDS